MPICGNVQGLICSVRRITRQCVGGRDDRIYGKVGGIETGRQMDIANRLQFIAMWPVRIKAILVENLVQHMRRNLLQSIILTQLLDSSFNVLFC